MEKNILKKNERERECVCVCVCVCVCITESLCSRAVINTLLINCTSIFKNWNVTTSSRKIGIKKLQESRVEQDLAELRRKGKASRWR